MSISAELYDKFQICYAFQVDFKIGDTLIGSWEWPAKRYSGSFLKRVRFPFKFKYLNENVKLILLELFL